MVNRFPENVGKNLYGIMSIPIQTGKSTQLINEREKEEKTKQKF